MYIKVKGVYDGWEYQVFSANNRQVLLSRTWWQDNKDKPSCIRAAKKMAKQLGIEYREDKNGKTN